LSPKSNTTNLANYNTNTFADGCTIYVCGTALKHFLGIVPKIPCKFILISGDCDESMWNTLSSSEYSLLINNENLIHWYSQNCGMTHEKLSKIPIGLDYHTISSSENHHWGSQKSPLEQESALLAIRKNMHPFYKRQPIAYSNFHFSLNNKYGKDRKKAVIEIPKEFVFYEPVFLQREESWKNQTQYAFVISPPGGGYDCHRTWEALILGCIPIITETPINDIFADLPVLVINEWKDITQELLEKTIMEFKTRTFNYHKLLLSYWTNKIKNHPRK
jgi:hypothetical protein